MPMTSRRRFLALSAGLAALPAASAPAAAVQHQAQRLRAGGRDGGFDPWIEIIGDHFRHNAREVHWCLASWCDNHTTVNRRRRRRPSQPSTVAGTTRPARDTTIRRTTCWVVSSS